jgi:hypothetical protein
MIYSTYLGGSDFDFGLGIAVDKSGRAYVTGGTDSTDLPIRNQLQGDQPFSDAFVTVLDTTAAGDASLVYSTYLGGNGNESGHAIAVDKSDRAYVTGSTFLSTDFPTRNQFQGQQPGEDSFVTVLDTKASGDASLVYSTYLGGDSSVGNGIAVDKSGRAYITGSTSSANFPTRNPFQGNLQGPEFDLDAFVTVLDTTAAGDASLIYSTYLGGSDFDFGLGIAVDKSGRAYVTGETVSTNFPTRNQLQGHLPGEDSFVTVLDTRAAGDASLVFSTYLGGSDHDAGTGIAVDESGLAYVTGETLSTDFPTVNALQPTFGSLQDAFVSKLSISSVNNDEDDE